MRGKGCLPVVHKEDIRIVKIHNDCASMELDEIFYTALSADETIVQLTEGRIESTCFEEPPANTGNTSVPNIVIEESIGQNELGTKDTIWESNTDVPSVDITINALSKNEVQQLRRLVRKAISSYIESMTSSFPLLRSLSWAGVQYDWTKPCYFDTLHYQCEMDINLEDDNNG